MTLYEFVLEQHARLEKFKVDWLKENQANPEMYPLTLPAGEWFEQLLAAETI